MRQVSSLSILHSTSDLSHVSNHVSAVVATHYPEMAARMRSINDKVFQWFGLRPEFGLFWNFCVNAPYHANGVPEVVCRPRLDAQNGAILLCAVLVYYVRYSEHGCLLVSLLRLTFAVCSAQRLQ